MKKATVMIFYVSLCLRVRVISFMLTSFHQDLLKAGWKINRNKISWSRWGYEVSGQYARFTEQHLCFFFFELQNTKTDMVGCKHS